MLFGLDLGIIITLSQVIWYMAFDDLPDSKVNYENKC